MKFTRDVKKTSLSPPSSMSSLHFTLAEKRWNKNFARECAQAISHFFPYVLHSANASAISNSGKRALAEGGTRFRKGPFNRESPLHIWTIFGPFLINQNSICIVFWNSFEYFGEIIADGMTRSDFCFCWHFAFQCFPPLLFVLVFWSNPFTCQQANPPFKLARHFNLSSFEPTLSAWNYGPVCSTGTMGKMYKWIRNTTEL